MPSITASFVRSAVLALGIAASTASANIVNGSFESGSPYGGAPGALTYLSPGTPAPWFATVFTPDLYDNTGAQGYGLSGHFTYDNMFQGMVAHDGNRFIGFAAATFFGGISEAFAQTTSPLTAGALYTMSAAIAADDTGRGQANFGGPYTGRGEVNVLLNGNLIGVFTQNTLSLTWETRSFSFIAPAASSYTFEFIAQLSPGNPGRPPESSYIGLDGITLVPTPGAAAVLGLGGLLAARRRRVV